MPLTSATTGLTVAGVHVRLELERAWGAVAPGVGEPALRGLRVLGEVERAHREQLGLVAAEQPAEPAVDAAEAAVGADDRHAGRRVAEGLAQALGVRLVAAADVARDDVAQAGVVVDDGAHLGPADVGAGPGDPHAELLVADVTVGRDLLEDAADAVEVLRVHDVPERARERGVLAARRRRAAAGFARRIEPSTPQTTRASVASSNRRCSNASCGMSGRWCTGDRGPLEMKARGYVSAHSRSRVECLPGGTPRAGRRGRRAQRRGPANTPVRTLAFARRCVIVDVREQPPPNGAASRPPVSAHFVNNVLAAAASYIDEDPDYARDVLAELGQFLSYRLREDPAPVSAAQELAHTATFLRLQQARFPDRITVQLPIRPTSSAA